MSPLTPAVVVHGGAGDIDAARHPACVAGCEAAAAAGLAVLTGGGSALDAAQAAVRVLEEDPEFNAGVGSVLTRDGTIEVDAALMCGATRRYGAVAAVPALRRPIDGARAVLDDGEHALLVGEAAWAFLGARGLSRDLDGAMITPRARARLASPGTVGACAVDAAGRFAAATSTGGLTGKRPGRVGDSPLPGCGTWADARCAASATGPGEAILRVTLTRALAHHVAQGAAPDAAARAALAELATLTGAHAGVISLGPSGAPGLACTTATMPWAFASADGARAADVAPPRIT